MKNPRDLQHALLCLKAVRDGHLHPCTPLTISQSQGIPIVEVQAILERFEAAGFLKRGAGNRIDASDALAHLTALDILKALWTPAVPSVRLRYVPPSHLAVRVTLRAVHRPSTHAEAFGLN